MRTTLTLEKDVAAALERMRKARKATLKQVLDDALRAGLAQMAAPAQPRRSVSTRAVSLGRCLVGNLHRAPEKIASGFEMLKARGRRLPPDFDPADLLAPKARRRR